MTYPLYTKNISVAYEDGNIVIKSEGSILGKNAQLPDDKLVIKLNGVDGTGPADVSGGGGKEKGVYLNNVMMSRLGHAPNKEVTASASGINGWDGAST